ncbi:MAG TPA: thioredoxin fold domain-containing protein [Candidatus Nanoarchaeia archaeon]|nr:thioredoxin fold domain-containing protein [Candidatus Nanoarchaeia archaeon]
MNDSKKNLLIILLGALLIFGSIYAATRNVTANDQSTADGNETIKLGLLSFHTNLSYALESAESENKMIYIYGHSENCGWCKQFEAESLSDERIIGILNENFILLSIDTVKQTSLALNLGIRGTPHSIFTTSEVQEIPGARIPGYVDREFFHLHLSGIINNEE